MVYTRFGHPVTVVKIEELHKGDKRLKGEQPGTFALVSYQDRDKERWYPLYALRADGGIKEIMASVRVEIHFGVCQEPTEVN